MLMCGIVAKAGLKRIMIKIIGNKIESGLNTINSPNFSECLFEN